MPAREAILDPLLALHQPVHRRVQIVLVGARDPELVGERRPAERPRRSRASTPARSPAGRPSPAPDPAPATADRSISRASSSRRAIASTALTCPAGSDRSIANALRQHARPLAAQPARISSISSGGRCERFAERLVLDLAALAVGAAQQMRDVLPPLPPPPVGDDVHRTRRTRPSDITEPYPHRPDRILDNIDDYTRQHKKGRNPSNHKDSGLPDAVIDGNFGLVKQRPPCPPDHGRLANAREHDRRLSVMAGVVVSSRDERLDTAAPSLASLHSCKPICARRRPESQNGGPVRTLGRSLPGACAWPRVQRRAHGAVLVGDRVPACRATLAGSPNSPASLQLAEQRQQVVAVPRRLSRQAQTC